MSILSRALFFGLVPVVYLAAQDLELRDVRIIDGTGSVPLNSARFSIHSGHILSIHNTTTPATRSLMPAIIDVHAHLGLTRGTNSGAGNYTRENLDAQLHQYQRFGVGAILSLGMNLDLLYNSRGRSGGVEVFSAEPRIWRKRRRAPSGRGGRQL